MPYNNNTPLATDVIANTTDPIRNNFAFLQTDLQYDHSFNGNLVGIQEGAHGKCSMPSIALSPALGTMISGVYFVNNGVPYFYDGTTNYILNSANRLSGSGVVLDSSTFSTVVAVPANSVGYIVLYNDTANVVQFGSFFSTASACRVNACTMAVSGGSAILYTRMSNSGLNLTARTNGSFAGTWSYRLFYGA